MRTTTVNNPDGSYTMTFHYNVCDRVNQFFRWASRPFTPFKKGFIQYTTFKRWCKAAICYYILSPKENFLVFGAWEKAIFIKPKPKGSGNWLKEIIYKADGNYECKRNTFGFGTSFIHNFGGKWVTKNTEERDLPTLDMNYFHGQIGDKTYTDKNEFDAVRRKKWEEENSEEVAEVQSIVDQYMEILGKDQ